MRIAIAGSTLTVAGPRVHHAILGLVRRGHHVGWRGPGRPASEPGLEGGGAADEIGADVVIGGGAPASVAHAAWRTRAHAMVLAVTAAEVRGWKLVDRWAWDSLWALALIEEADADAIRAGGHGVPLERFALWSGDAAPEAPDVAHADADVLERACERALARSRGPAMRAAAFVDRDGTLIAERGYLADPAELELLPGVASALRQTREAGHPIVVISNQAGVGRGRFPLASVHEVMAELRRALRREGVELDAIYFCPHTPDAGCACRKPGTLLFERAADDQQISLVRSVMVGDKRLDAAAGIAAGATGVLVRSGYGRDEEAKLGDGEYPPPDRVAENLGEALHWFCEREDSRPG